MNLHFRIAWQTEKEKYRGIAKELVKLRKIFKSNTGYHIAYESGEIQFGSALKMKSGEIIKRLEETYSKKEVSVNNKVFVITL